ncbi:hypothetical protein, partial [Streptomyces sp. NPDC056689]|uniref:hypothetical protein n=1 Tax=Streptomyces sp. NPDC056689 TaxID=3345911 RepID=UPI0036965BFD
MNAFAFQTAVTKDKPLADGLGLLLPKRLDDERACPGWCLAQCSAGAGQRRPRGRDSGRRRDPLPPELCTGRFGHVHSSGICCFPYRRANGSGLHDQVD